MLVRSFPLNVFSTFKCLFSLERPFWGVLTTRAGMTAGREIVTTTCVSTKAKQTEPLSLLPVGTNR